MSDDQLKATAPSDSQNSEDTPASGTMQTFDNASLTAALDRYDETVNTALERWQLRTADQTLGSLKRVLSESRTALASLLHVFNSADISTPATCRGQVLRYRKDVRNRVLLPILEHLKNEPPSHTSSDAYIDLLGSIKSASDGLPVSAEIKDDVDDFAMVQGDSLWMRTKKWNYRRRIKSSADAYVRRVRARFLAEYNSTVRIPQFVAPMHNELQQQIADHLFSLEKGIADWANSLLVLDRPLSEFVRERADESMLPIVRALNPEQPEEEGVPGSDLHDSDPPASTKLDSNAGAVQDDKSVQPGVQKDSQPDVERKQDPSAIAIEKVATTLRSDAEMLIGLFDQLSNSTPVARAATPQQINGARRALREDLRQAGTPFLRYDERVLIDDAYGPAAKGRQTLSTWLTWNRQVVNRFGLYNVLLLLREQMIEAERSILTDVAKLSIQPVYKTFDRIKKVLAESSAIAESAARDVADTGDLADLRRSIEQLKKNNSRFLARTLHDLPGMVSADTILADPGEGPWANVMAVVESCPAEVQIHELKSEPGRLVNPHETPRFIALKSRLGEAILPISKRLKSGGGNLRKVLLQIWTDVEKTKTAVDYNLDTAAAELERIRTGTPAVEDEVLESETEVDTTELAVQRTTELVIKGYERAAVSLDELLPALGDPWNHFSETVLDEAHQQWAVALRKARTGDPDEADWEGLAATIKRSWQGTVTRGSEVLSRTGQRSKTRFVALRRRARRLIRIGRTAVGALEINEEDLVRTLDEIGRVAEIRKELPLVYRHLFSFEPLVESALFEVRSADLAWIKDRILRWGNGIHSGSIVVSAPVGGGRTTFLNIISDSLLEEYPHQFIRPTRRMGESELAKLFFDAFELEPTSLTLDALELAIIQRGELGQAPVCLIDDLDYFFLKSAGGTVTLERFILLMTRTDRCVRWIAAVGDLAWRYLQSTTGSITTSLAHRQLSPVRRDGLEEIIMARHKRSAMPLQFTVSQAQSDAMRRWLSRSRSEEEIQQYARSQYFDRLHRQAGQNIMLALFYWIRSARFSDDSDSVEIQPLEPLRFETLSKYPMQQAFSLEAFLFHKTLSLREHNEVLRLEVEEGTMLLEALLNARLLVRVRTDDEELDGAANGQILPDDRFRIRPLLINPIRATLTHRHLVY